MNSEMQPQSCSVRSDWIQWPVRFLKFIAIRLIKGYQYWISPFLPASCRFYPSCSQYALESYQALGFWRGSYLSLKRILKCHPFHPGGYDPVPGDVHATESGKEKKCCG